MNTIRSLSVAAILCLLPTPGFSASSLCVNPGGTGGCFSSITAALVFASRGSTIDIAAGTYADSIQILTDHVMLRGAGAGVTSITSSGGPACPVALCLAGKGAVVEGLSIAGVHVQNDARRPRALLRSVVIAGSATDGLRAFGRAAVDVKSSTISGNAGIGISVVGANVRVKDSTVSGNLGGTGLLRAGGVSNVAGKVAIVSSTVSGNSSPICGGITNLGNPGPRGRMSIVRSTIAGNTATAGDGGGICNDGTLTIRDSIVADNAATGAGPDCVDQSSRRGNRIVVRGTALIENPADCAPVVPGAAALLTGDPLLGALQDNGGPTFTQALSPGSPAIGVLVKATQCRHPDQRGVERSVPCDLGAYEAP